TGSGLGRILEQPEVLAGPLAPWADHLAASAGDRGTEIGAVWGALYRGLAGRYPAAAWPRHEAACAQPAARMEGALARPGGAVHDRGRAYLRAWLDTYDREGDERMNIFRARRAVVDRWRTELAPEVAGRVLAAAEPFGVLDRLG